MDTGRMGGLPRSAAYPGQWTCTRRRSPAG